MGTGGGLPNTRQVKIGETQRVRLIDLSRLPFEEALMLHREYLYHLMFFQNTSAKVSKWNEMSGS